MMIRDLDGITKNWNLTGYAAKARIKNKSLLHLRARTVINSIYPTLQVLEEVSIPLRNKEHLFLDFYLPLLKKCIEVHGEQHYKFTAMYHSNQLGFIKQKKRDADKELWCEQNNIKYIALPFSENDDEWSVRINEY